MLLITVLIYTVVTPNLDAPVFIKVMEDVGRIQLAR